MDINNLSFDPAHPWFDLPGLPGAQWTIEVFTTENAAGIDPASVALDQGRVQAARLQQLGGQRPAGGSLDATVSIGDDGAVTWTIAASAPEPVKSVKLLLRGLPAASLATGWWTPTTARGQTLTHGGGEPILLRYPWDNWQTPWACAGEGPGVVVSVRDTTVRAVRLYAYEPHWARGPIVEIVCEASAVARAVTFEAPPIRLRFCGSEAEIHDDFEAHLSWLERVHGLTQWSDRADKPDWADEIDLVLTLHGQHWTGFVFNTFDQMAAILEDVTADIPGQRVLAYLPGWEGRYYWQYPSYRPGEDLGGEEGFARLVATARRLGAHLMPMFGANGANVNRYPNWERAAFRSPSDRYVALVNSPDWDNDRAPEDDQVFLNPGEPGFRQHLVDEIVHLVDTYGVEGVFLDTSACWFNDPRYDVYEGYVALTGAIRERCPDILVCGEGWYDALLALFPMNQTWIEMDRAPRFDDLPMRYTRVLGHLRDGAPGDGSTGVHESGANPVATPVHANGFVPALGVVSDTFSTHREAVRAFCRAAREPA